MSEHRQRLVTSLCVLALLAVVLLSILVAPDLYAAVVRRPVLDPTPFERPAQAPGSFTALGPDTPFPLPLNTADARTLALIPQLDDRAAELVVGARNLLGGFRSVEQLAPLLGVDEETFAQIAAYLYLDSYAAGGLPEGLDAEAEVDRLIGQVAAQLAAADIDDAGSLGELVSLMRLCRERLVELMGEPGLAQRTDYDTLLEMLALRLDLLTGAAA